MSIFKVKPWWSNEQLQSDQSNIGVQNYGCVKVDKFNAHYESDCIIVGKGNLLSIYKPNTDQDSSHTLLETELGGPILQVEIGKFIAGSGDRQILVLHPQTYAIYQLNRKEGHTDAGDQNSLNSVLKHSFTRKAYSLTCGSFGNIKTRDFICIQALDGSLSFFDQDTFLFLCLFNDVIIPGPVNYIASCDSFVICKSNWVLEIYSYQQLREFSELNVRQNRKNVPQWIYNAGEEVTSIQVIQTSTNISSIIALGERHLYCFQDNGLMKYMLKFDFMPVCFFAYLIGWYYEPTARLLIMVASDDAKLYVYEGTRLMWSCDLLHPSIAISRCFVKSLPGGLVTLSTNGILAVSYIGTEPDLNPSAAPMMNENLEPEQLQAELEEIEEKLHKILNSKNDETDQYPKVSDLINIKADVGKPIQNLFQEFTRDNDTMLHLLMCPVVVILTCSDPKLVQSIQITYACCPPFASSDSAICLDNINGSEIIETQVFLTNEADVTQSAVNIMFTITDTAGKVVVLSRKVVLPLSLYCVPSDIITDNSIILQIVTNKECAKLAEIFTDFSEGELSKHGTANNVLTFSHRATKKSVTIKGSDGEYSIEANDFPEIGSILDYLIFKLTQYYMRMGVKDFEYKFKYDDEFVKLMIHKFLKSIEAHAKYRIVLKNLEDSLAVLQNQFTLIQKKLLVQYGSLPPGDCDPLEYLMKDTHSRIIECVQEIIQRKETVSGAGSTLTAVGNLVICVLKNGTADAFKVKLVEEMLSLSSLYEDYQDWEEAVTQALTYILNNIFKKSEKDKEKLAPVTEQGILSQINLKRFLKQIRIIIEKMFSESEDLISQTNENKITRIEEFVEVI